MAGKLEYFDVACDAPEALREAIKITQKWNSKVTHYRTGKDVEGVPYLIFLWHDDGKGSLPLIAPMESADAIADQIYAWLKMQDYGHQPDHDGSNNKGWRVTIRGPVKEKKVNPYYDPDKKWSEKYNLTYDHTSYDVFCVQPWWIEYHK